MCLLCLCVYAWWILGVRLVSECRYHSTSPPPAEVFAPTPYICSCVFAIAASCSQPIHYFLFYPWGATTQNKGEKVAQFPPLESLTPRETFAPKHSQRMHSLALLSDLQWSWSGWLIHSHTAELFKLPRLDYFIGLFPIPPCYSCFYLKKLNCIFWVTQNAETKTWNIYLMYNQFA